MLTLLYALAALLVAGSLWTWALVLDRLRRRQPIVPFEPRRELPWDLRGLLAVTAFYLVAQSVASVAVRSAAPDVAPLESPIMLTWLLAANSAAGALTFCLVLGVNRIYGGTLADLGLRRETFLADLRLGGTAFVAVSLPIYALQALLTQLVPSKHPIVELLRAHPEVSLFLASLLSAVVVAPVVEELLFRALLQGWLEKRISRLHGANAANEQTGISDAAEPTNEPPFSNPHEARAPNANPYAAPQASEYSWRQPDGPAAGLIGRSPRAGMAIVISSLLFAAMHLGHGPDPVPLFVLALALGYLYRQTHRILPSIVVHVSLNACSLVVLWLEIAG